MSSNVVQETVVRLGTQIDNEGVSRLLSFLDSSKMKALTLTAAITGLSTAIYKLVESATKREFELEQLAKQQSKSIALVRAENSALKAMGTTLNEINKNQHLKKIYEDVVKFNKELAFPNISDALRRVEGLQTSFYKLKSVLGSAIQWINAQILTNLEAPIQRLDGYLSKGATWLRDNMGRYSSKIALFVSDFAKGIFGIAEGVGKIFDWVNKLPEGIKAVGAAIAGAFAFFKGGTIGKVLMAIELIGDLMHDYDNWQKNRTEGTNIPVAFGDLYEIYDNKSLSGEEKAGKIATRLLERISGALNTAFRDFDMSKVFGDGTDGNGGLIGAIKRWFDNENNRETLKSFGESIIGFITRGIKEVGGTVGGAAAAIFDAIFDMGALETVTSDADGSTGTTLAFSLGGFIKNFTESIGKGGKFHEAFMSGLGGGLFGAIIGTLASNLFDDEGNFNPNWEAMGVDLKNVGKFFSELIIKGLDAIDDLGGMIFSEIGTLLKDSENENSMTNPLAKAIGDLGKDGSVLGGILAEGAAGWFATGSFIGGIITGIAGAIRKVIEDPKNADKLVEEIKSFAKDFGTFFDLIWNGTMDEQGNRSGGLAEFFKKLWEGDEEGGGMKSFFEGIAEKISEWLSPVKDAIVSFFDSLWLEIYDRLPGVLRGAFGEDPNRSTMTESNGEHVLKDKHNRTHILTTEEYNWLMKGGYADGNGGYEVGIDEKGNLYGTGSHSSEWAKDVRNAVLRNYAYDIESGANVGYSVYYNPNTHGYYSFNTDEYGDINWESGDKYKVGNNGELTKLTEDQVAGYKNAVSTGLTTFQKVHSETDRVATDLSALGTSLEALIEKINELNISDEGEKAWGGRIASEGHYTVGEDGPEYIIPVTKPERAMQLINQALSEMGMGALNSIRGDFGIGSSSGFGSSIDSLLGSFGGNTNVSAPINIYVTATGSDAKEIGQSAYDAAERHLVKTLRGVYA